MQLQELCDLQGCYVWSVEFQTSSAALTKHAYRVDRAHLVLRRFCREVIAVSTLGGKSCMREVWEWTRKA
jgi:hypothetical protein